MFSFWKKKIRLRRNLQPQRPLFFATERRENSFSDSLYNHCLKFQSPKLKNTVKPRISISNFDLRFSNKSSNLTQASDQIFRPKLSKKKKIPKTSNPKSLMKIDNSQQKSITAKSKDFSRKFPTPKSPTPGLTRTGV